MRADPPDQEVVGAGVEDGADPRERRADPGVVRDVHDVTRQREPEPGAERGAVHRRERRHGEPGQALDDRVQRVVQDRFAVLVRRVGVGQISSGAEATPLTAHDECAHPGRLDPVETTVQIGDHRFVDRVELVGPVEHQLRVAGIDLQPHGVSHRALPRVVRRIAATGHGRYSS